MLHKSYIKFLPMKNTIYFHTFFYIWKIIQCQGRPHPHIYIYFSFSNTIEFSFGNIIIRKDGKMWESEKDEVVKMSWNLQHKTFAFHRVVVAMGVEVVWVVHVFILMYNLNDVICRSPLLLLLFLQNRNITGKMTELTKKGKRKSWMRENYVYWGLYYNKNIFIMQWNT